MRISRTCVPSRVAAHASGSKNVAEEVDVEQEEVDIVDVVAAVVLAPVVVSEAGGLDHTRGSVAIMAMPAVMIIALTHYIHRLVPNTCMKFKAVRRLFDAMVRHRGARQGEHRPRQIHQRFHPCLLFFHLVPLPPWLRMP